MDPLTIALLASVAGAGANKLFSGMGGNDQNGFQQRSRLNKQQKPLMEQAINAGLQPGAGGAFGQSADYYRGLLSDNPADMQAFAAPEMRRFNEEIIPGISEQFAGMGSGGLSSSGFRNAAINAGTDLSERLGAIRANLRQQSAQGLMNVGRTGLEDYSINSYQQNAPGFLELASQGIGQAGTAAIFDYLKNKPASPGISGATGKYVNQVSTKGTSSPYGQVGVTQRPVGPGVGF